VHRITGLGLQSGGKENSGESDGQVADNFCASVSGIHGVLVIGWNEGQMMITRKRWLERRGLSGKNLEFAYSVGYHQRGESKNK
jgi:hypothetical protein